MSLSIRPEGFCSPNLLLGGLQQFLHYVDGADVHGSCAYAFEHILDNGIELECLAEVVHDAYGLQVIKRKIRYSIHTAQLNQMTVAGTTPSFLIFCAPQGKNSPRSNSRVM
jgi:hypothetical protein